MVCSWSVYPGGRLDSECGAPMCGSSAAVDCRARVKATALMSHLRTHIPFNKKSVTDSGEGRTTRRNSACHVLGKEVDCADAGVCAHGSDTVSGPAICPPTSKVSRFFPLAVDDGGGPHARGG